MIQFGVLPSTDASVSLNSRTQMLPVSRDPGTLVGGLPLAPVVLVELAEHGPVAQLHQAAAAAGTAGTGEAPAGLAASPRSTSWTEQYSL